MPRIALVTARAARGTDYDMPPLLQAMAAAGADAVEADWDDPAVDWAGLDLAVLRSPWDYVHRHGEFLAWARRTSALTRLLNPLSLVEWNSDKHYLADLASRGVDIVPTRFVEPGADCAAAVDAFLAAFPDAAAVVAKPAIGAGSRDARQHARGERDALLEHVAGLAAAGRSVLLQPYLDAVDRDGETALVFLHGRFSHAIGKGALLRPGAAATRALYAEEDIRAREAAADEHDLATRALAAVPVSGPLAYARVDLIRAGDGSPRLLELELVEPSLFFDHGPGSATRFAEGLVALAG